MTRAIVIQGPSNYVEVLKAAWNGYDIIWSTWIGEEGKYSPEDIVIFNEKPNDTGIQNITLQYKTTIEGIRKAKELGYDRVLKWRSDMIPNNPKALIETFDGNSLNFLAWHIGGYFVDYFVEGKADEVYAAWDIDRFYADFSERITTDNILSKGLNNINFISNYLTTDNEIYWIKKNVRLSHYKNNIAFTNNVIK